MKQNMKQNDREMSLANLIKLVSIIAIPVALQNLLSSTGSMLDTMMIGSLGETSVAAVGLCAQFSVLMFSSYWGFAGGGVLFISQHYGNKDHDGIKRAYGMMISCMMIMAFIFACLALLTPEFVMSIYTDKADIREVGVRYFRIIGFAYPLEVLSIGMSVLLRCIEHVKIPLYASIVSVCVNVFLNWVLIYGNLGMPMLGVSGAAIATLIAAFVNVVFLYVMAKVKGCEYLFDIRGHFKWSRESLPLFVKKCFPIICNELAMGISGFIVNIVLGHQVSEGIAALAVFRTIEGLIIGFFSGFSNASSVLVGTCVGAGKHFEALSRAKRIVYMCQFSIFVLIVIVIAIHEPLLRMMSLSGESLRIGTGLLIIYGVACVIRMGNWTMNDTYRASGDTITGTVLEIVFMYVLVIPTVLIAAYKFKASFLTIFALCYIDEPIRYVIMQIHMYSGKWIRPVTKEGKESLEKFRLSRRKVKKKV